MILAIVRGANGNYSAIRIDQLAPEAQATFIATAAKQEPEYNKPAAIDATAKYYGPLTEIVTTGTTALRELAAQRFGSPIDFTLYHAS
jgi:hypothetical protein